MSWSRLACAALTCCSAALTPAAAAAAVEPVKMRACYTAENAEYCADLLSIFSLRETPSGSYVVTGVAKMEFTHALDGEVFWRDYRRENFHYVVRDGGYVTYHYSVVGATTTAPIEDCRFVAVFQETGGEIRVQSTRIDCAVPGA